MAVGAPKAIKITRQEALTMQWSMIGRWKPRHDVWPFTYGNAILASTASLTGIYFNTVYRKVLRLGSNGYKTSFFPLAILPTAFSALAHATLISSDILLKETACPSCIESKAVVAQLCTGMLYPIVFAPITSMYLAKSFYTYDVPDVYKVRELAKLWWSMTRRNTGRIQVIIVCQALLAAAVTYMERGALDRIEAKMMRGEVVP